MPGTDPGHLDTVVLDVDGTLVDSVYHHVRTWHDAFLERGVEVPAWRIHRAIGMGGDRLVTEVAGQAVEDEHGDALRSEQADALAALTGEIRPLPGAAELVTGLREAGLRVVIASSGNREQTERLLAVVDADHEPDAVAAGADAEASKPDSQVVDVAVESVSGRSAVVVGDATWDMQAARDGGHPGWAVLTGGISEAELREAGAEKVFPGAHELLEHLRRVVGGA